MSLGEHLCKHLNAVAARWACKWPEKKGFAGLPAAVLSQGGQAVGYLAPYYNSTESKFASKREGAQERSNGGRKKRGKCEDWKAPQQWETVLPLALDAQTASGPHRRQAAKQPNGQKGTEGRKRPNTSTCRRAPIVSPGSQCNVAPAHRCLPQAGRLLWPSHVLSCRKIGPKTGKTWPVRQPRSAKRAGHLPAATHTHRHTV